MEGVFHSTKAAFHLRTVIVTAAVHWGFSSVHTHIPLTFQHRAGVSPYTSTFVLAETYVFGKQLHGFLSCSPITLSVRQRVEAQLLEKFPRNWQHHSSK
jgi:hypothetical protein